MIRRYPVLANKEDGGSWAVSLSDLPIHVIESSLDDALAQCQEAFEEFMRDETVLPDPSPIETVAESSAARAATVVLLVQIDTSFFEDPTVRKTASAKKSQWEAIDLAAKRAGVTRSAFMVAASLERVREMARDEG